MLIQIQHEILLASYFDLVSLHNVLTTKSDDGVGELSPATCLYNNYEGGLEERWVSCWI